MIFYLSGTGNTRWVAEQLACSLGERLVDVAAAVDGDCTYRMESGELLGFCFPVHGWRPPMLMRRFINKVKIRGGSDAGRYSFAVCTEGDTVGEAMNVFCKLCSSEKGIRISSCFDVRMPNTYVGLPFMDVDGKKLEKEKLDAAAERLDEIAGRLKKREKGSFVDHEGRWRRINTRVLGAAFDSMLVSDKKFRADANLCTGCGRCAKACLVGNIRIGSGAQPEWLHNGKCMTCFACYHKCPVRAIRYGMMTMGKGQYFFRPLAVKKIIVSRVW